jgi:hypothetical protein
MMVTKDALWLSYVVMPSFARRTRQCREIRTRVTNTKSCSILFQSIYYDIKMSGKDVIQ